MSRDYKVREITRWSGRLNRHFNSKWKVMWVCAYVCALKGIFKCNYTFFYG